LIIWGASIGPFTQDPSYEKYIAGQLKRAIIFARESSTIEYCNSIGLKENVYKVADPAFMMEPRMPDLAQLGFELAGDFVGLNFSPLVAKYAAQGNLDLWIKHCVDIVKFVLSHIPCKVLLIPHVVSAHDNDLICLRAIKKTFKNDSRVILVNADLAADEVKYVISKCKLFIGTRTHATIAALSSGVPTLSLGYSLKSVGINKDIFGSDLYFFNLSKFELELINEKIINLWKCRDSVVAHLIEKRKIVAVGALSSGELLKQILRG
jgi:polysaccharide pyruvyl transferase WcaK-like protein